jgi:DDE superfamily endonuclease
LVEPDLWELVPADVADLLRLLPTADLYVQDEVDIRLHPTLTRCWSRKGRRGQRLVRAPGQSHKVVGFAAADWRDGWLSHGIALGRTAGAYCQQLRHVIARSQERQRTAIVLADNLGIHTPRGSKKLRDLLAEHADLLCLVYTPAYDPEASPAERLWPSFRRQVTHNHHRDTLVDLYHDARAYFAALDYDPRRVLRQIGSPTVTDSSSCRLRAHEKQTACGMI